MGDSSTSWRRKELANFGPEVMPLDGPQAVTTYERAMGLCSRTRYGLNEVAFKTIERLDIALAEATSQFWLADRIDEGELLLVYGRNDVFLIPARLFLNCWQDMFLPSRDDVVIIPVDWSWVLFYCHEDEFEFARTVVK